MEKMREKTRTLTTSQIVDAVVMIGGGIVSAPLAMTRAILLDVYEEREGSDAADKLMDNIGL